MSLLSDPNAFRGLRVAVFGFDLAEASQVRRIRSLLSLGCDVTSFCPRREGSTPGFTPEWRNFDLGLVRQGAYLRRGLALPMTVAKALRGRKWLRQADVIIARNLDMAAVAHLARRMAGVSREIPLVYECLDVHPLLTRGDSLGRLMRWSERRVLARAAQLVVSSRGFTESYFRPVQGYDGPAALVENKLWLDDISPSGRLEADEVPSPAGPLVLGLVGAIRCQRSVDLLLETADRMGRGLKLRFAGHLDEHAVRDFPQQVAARSNVDWTGAYACPEDLGSIYRDCDLVWGQDMWQPGGNSDWLLPSRLYEAGWNGCPVIAVEGSETARRVDSDRLGYVIARPDSATLAGLLGSINRDDLTVLKRDLLTRPAESFVQKAEDLMPFLTPALRRANRAVPRMGQQLAKASARS